MPIGDEKELKSLLSHWLNAISENQKMHYRAAARYTKLHYIVGVPVIILSAVAGTSIFANLERQPSMNMKIILGTVSILVAVLTSLQTFLRFTERAVKHNESSSKLGDVKREIEYLLSITPQKPDEYEKRIADISKKLFEIAAGSPVIDFGNDPPLLYSIKDFFRK